MMKQLLKAVLPPPFINYAVGVKDRVQLSVAPVETFDFSLLGKFDDIELDDIFSNEKISQYWNEDQPEIAKVFGSKDMNGGVNPGDRRALYYLVMGLKPQNILEIGTHIGSSTLHMAYALKRLNNQGRVTTVDILDVNAPDAAWKSVGMDKTPRECAKALDCDGFIDFHHSTGLSCMSSTRRRYDLIFLDGDHRAHTVYRELQSCMKLLNPGGIILLHDYYPDGKALFANKVIINGPYLAVKRAQNEHPNLKIQPLGRLPWPTKLGSSRTSLAILVKDGA